MVKNKWGKFLALATAAGAIAAGISYFVKYKTFSKELDEDFHDFEGGEEDFDGSLPHESEAPERTYVTLGEKKAEVSEAVSEAAETVKDAAKETVTSAVDAAKEKAEDVSEAAEKVVSDAAETVKETVSEAAEKVKAATTIEEDTVSQ